LEAASASSSEIGATSTTGGLLPEQEPKMNLIQLQSHHLQHQTGPDQMGSLKLSMDQLTGLPLTSPTSGTNELGSQGESSGRSTPSSDSAPGKLFVGGLSWQTSQDKLREYFGQFGNVTDVLVMKDPITQVAECVFGVFGVSRATDM